VARKIGIDVGYDRCYIACETNGEANVVLNRQNERATPSAVARWNGEWVVGRLAMDLAVRQPQAVLRDPLGQLADGGTVSFNGEAFTPEEVLAVLLAKLREDTEYRLGEDVLEAVLAVPSDLPSALQECLCTVAEQAKWPVRQMIPRSIAATVTSQAALPRSDRILLLVLDWSDRRLEASLLWVEEGNLVSLLTISEPELGAVKFREAVVAYALEKVQQEHGVDGSQQPRFLQELRQAAEHALQELETQDSSYLVVIGALKGEGGEVLDLEMDLARSDYEQLIGPAVAEAMAVADRVLAAAGVTPEQVESVLLLGSIARIPLLQREAAGKFGQEKILPGVDPEECAVCGAAHLAEATASPLQVRYPEDPRAFLQERLLGRPPEASLAEEPPSDVEVPRPAAEPPEALKPAEESEPAEPMVIEPEAPEPLGVREAELLGISEEPVAGEELLEPSNGPPEPAESAELEAPAAEALAGEGETPIEEAIAPEPVPERVVSEPMPGLPAEIEPAAAEEAGSVPQELLPTAPVLPEVAIPEPAGEVPEEVEEGPWGIPEAAAEPQAEDSFKPTETVPAEEPSVPPPPEPEGLPEEPESVAPPLAGELGQFGRYRVVRSLSEGAHYTCYLAEDALTAGFVRIKAYSVEDARAKRAFARALTAYHLRHPNVEKILDFGMEGSSLFVVFEGTDRSTLRELFRSRGRRQPLPIKQALEIAVGIGKALDALHGIGLFHRNIKPENIVVPSEGHPIQLTGFDVCEFLLPGQRSRAVVGTLLYMAPEVLQGQADCRADLYSAAVVLYEMVTGVVPFREEDIERVKAHILHDWPPPPLTLNPAVSRELNAIIMRGLEKDPVRRAFSTEDLRRVLEKGPTG